MQAIYGMFEEKQNLEAQKKIRLDAASTPYHTLGVNLEGIAWLTVHHSDQLLDIIKRRRVRELEGMPPEDPVSEEQLQNHKSVLDQLIVDDAIGYDWMFVMQEVGKKHGGKSLVEILLNDNGGRGVGKATHFLSWWMKYPVGTILPALESFAEKQEGDPSNIFFYINTFSLRQPAELNMTCEGEAFQSMLSRLFSKSVASAGHTIFLIDDWTNPGALRRAWCLLEVLESRLQEGCQFSVILPDRQVFDLLLALRNQHPKGYTPRTIVEIYSDISAEKAEAGNGDDKEMIFGRIEREVGFKQLDELVKGNMRRWQEQQMDEELAYEGVNADDRLLAGAGELAWLLQHFDKALTLFQRRLDRIEWAYGEGSIQTASTLVRIADVYNKQRAYAKALGFYTRSLDIYDRTFGEDSIHSADTLLNMAGVYNVQGNPAKALEFFQRSLTIREKAHGEGKGFTQTAITLDNMAGIYADQEDYAKALELFQRSLVIYERAYGECSIEAADTLYNIATAYRDLQDYATALEFFKRGLAIKSTVLGDDHPDTIQLQECCDKIMGMS
jgi:tetratricopeptide (TPR) repeat protein